MSTAIETRGLIVKRSDRIVLSEIDMQIEEGESVAIVGKSGAGKSTLLHALAGHLSYAGAVRIPCNVSMVFQQHVLFPWLTVERNVAFGLTMDKEAMREWTRECLDIAGLGHKSRAYPATLSGGEQQRVAIARAIAHRPDVLLMDEPFGSLDALTREMMQQWLVVLRAERKITTLIVTHDIDEAIKLGDRALVMRDNHIVANLNTSMENAKEAIRTML